MLLGIGQISGHHFLHHVVQRDFWHPAKFFFGFGGVAEQGFDFCGAEVAGVDFDDGAGALTPTLSQGERE